jgi:BTB/POZ domain
MYCGSILSTVPLKGKVLANPGCNTDRNIVVFDVGGRLFKIRRSILESFPYTILAQSASDLWNTRSAPVLVLGSTEGEFSSTPATSEENNKKHQQPIFIDRDSHRFSYVLDYMRDGSIALPITISKESFLKDLHYFGFDEETINNDCITCIIPGYNAIMQIGHLHSKFGTRMQRIAIERDCNILAYVCFCECVRTRTLTCYFDWQNTLICYFDWQNPNPLPSSILVIYVYSTNL